MYLRRICFLFVAPIFWSVCWKIANILLVQYYFFRYIYITWFFCLKLLQFIILFIFLLLFLWIMANETFVVFFICVFNAQSIFFYSFFFSLVFLSEFLLILNLFVISMQSACFLSKITKIIYSFFFACLFAS